MKSLLSKPTKTFSLWRPLVIVAIVGGTLYLSLSTTTPFGKPEAGIVLNLPDQLQGMDGTEIPVSPEEIALLPKDTTFAKKSYAQPENGIVVSAQIVLGGADKRSIHRPEVCLPGQGWTIKSTQPITVPLSTGKNLSVTKLLLSRPHQTGPQTFKPLQLVFLYWFVSKDFSTSSHFTRILTNAWDMLVHNKLNRWAYIIVSAPVLEGFTANGKSEEETIALLKTFTAEMAPAIMKSEGAKEF